MQRSLRRRPEPLPPEAAADARRPIGLEVSAPPKRTAAVKDVEADVETFAQRAMPPEGLFDGPSVLSVACDPVGGWYRRLDRPSATIFGCFAATTDNE